MWRDRALQNPGFGVDVGVYGWVGYVAEFGLLTWPVIVLGRRRSGLGRPGPSFAAMALGLILCANLVDLIPNSGMSPLTWLVVGALVARWRFRWEPLPGSTGRSARRGRRQPA